MTRETQFDELAELAVQQTGATSLREVIKKELLHYGILLALDREGFLNRLTFHGGTALRLCYGSSRLSEDLDFAGGPNFSKSDLRSISDTLTNHISRLYHLEVLVKGPKDGNTRNKGISVDTWQISVITQPERRDRPRQRIKIDIATMTARTRKLLPVRRNYDVLPAGAGDLLMPVMSKDEILANKLVSLPASVYQKNIRLRDIWDIGWLSRHGGVVVPELVTQRVSEFKLDDYTERLDEMAEKLLDVVTGGQFEKEMSRFLPEDVVSRTFGREDFQPYITGAVGECLSEARSAIQGDGADIRRDINPEM